MQLLRQSDYIDKKHKSNKSKIRYLSKKYQWKYLLFEADIDR